MIAKVIAQNSASAIHLYYYNSLSAKKEGSCIPKNQSTSQPVSLDIIKPWSVTCPSTLRVIAKIGI